MWRTEGELPGLLSDGGRRRSAEPDEPHGRSSERSGRRLAIASRTSARTVHALAAPTSSLFASLHLHLSQQGRDTCDTRPFSSSRT